MFIMQIYVFMLCLGMVMLCLIYGKRFCVASHGYTLLKLQHDFSLDSRVNLIESNI